MIVESAKAKAVKVAIAESLTAGLVCAAIADTSGASEVLLGGIVSYQDEVKHQLLGVSAQLMATQSAVDPEVAIQMASGARTKFSQAMSINPDTVIGISTTGVAGPDPVGNKSVGEVYIGVSSAKGELVFVENFFGDRQSIREQAKNRCLEILREEIAKF